MGRRALNGKIHGSGKEYRFRKRVRMLAFGIAGTFVVLFFAVRPDRMIRVGTALTSQILCSEIFVAGQDPVETYREILKPMPRMWLIDWGLRIRVDRTLRQVTATVEGLFQNRAIYRPGLGCLVVHGRIPQDPPIPDEILSGRGRGAPNWKRRSPPGIDIDTPLLGWSATKSVTSALIGILVREGRLSVGRSAPIPEWHTPGDPRNRITVDDLLRMTSGIALDERDNGLDPWTQTLFLRRDMAGFVERSGLESPPGTRWNYTGANATVLSRILRDAAGGNVLDVVRFARRKLFDPLGMHHVTLEFDATGTPVGAAYMYASARDWARFGMLYAEGGVIDDHRILPKGWVRYSASPTPGASLGYGAGFWTNLGTSLGTLDRRHMGMPGDSFFASGLLGQYVVVVPSERLVVARFGATQNWPDFDIEGVSRLVSDVIAVLKEPSK